MLRRKLAESLTVRIFLLTFLLLLGAGGLTFALIAWATPITYTAVISDRLQAQVADLTQQLAQTNLADAGPILGGGSPDGPRRGGGGHRLPVGPAGGGLAGGRHHVRGGQLGPDL